MCPTCLKAFSDHYRVGVEGRLTWEFLGEHEEKDIQSTSFHKNCCRKQNTMQSASGNTQRREWMALQKGIRNAHNHNNKDI